MHDEHEWQVCRVVREVYILRCTSDDTFVKDTDGRVKEYPSEDTARFVAEHWDDFRAPSYAKLRAMSDDDLRREARRRGALESELA